MRSRSGTPPSTMSRSRPPSAYRRPPARFLPVGPRLFLLGTAVALLVAACGGGTSPSGSSPTSPAASPEVTLKVVARNIRFHTNQLEVPADTPFEVVFDNRDSGITHDFAIYRKGPPASDLVAKTEIERGPVVQELAVPGLAAGSYYYQCDVHPTQMTGTLKVI